MIKILAPDLSAEVVEIVRAAFARSFTSTMVEVTSFERIAFDNKLDSEVSFLVAINPLEAWSECLIAGCQQSCKLIILGEIPIGLATHLGVEFEPLPTTTELQALCEPAVAFHQAQSNMQVLYQAAVGAFESPIKRRPLVRYDFMAEWNNLGFGGILLDGSIWSVSGLVQVPEQAAIAHIVDEQTILGAYAALWDHGAASVLWFNRPVGPVDSQEWSLIEHYFSGYQYATQPCLPYVSEIPFGYQAAVTMRLDCDEDVESARPLWEAYQAMSVPFSLALHSKVLSDPVHHALPKAILADGGAILSHTATHAPNWGGSYEVALQEGSESRQLIAQHIHDEVDYAVSPFHHTPVYAREALAQVGYHGCIGGIICNDPDFLMARAGVPPFGQAGFIGHSQQCMLHGDCLLADGEDPMAVFKQAFEYAYLSNTFFGYLDHPFSERYQYGWQDEAQRIAAHQTLVQTMNTYDNVLFANAHDAMDFLSAKSTVEMHDEQGRYEIAPATSKAKWPISVVYQGERYAIAASGLTLDYDPINNSDRV